MAIFLHSCRYWKTSFLLQMYLNYSLCRIYFGFQVHTCLFFGIQISETKYLQMICGDLIKSTCIWTLSPWDFSHFSDFELTQGIRARSYHWLGLRISTMWSFFKRIEAEILWSNLFADLNLTRRRCAIIRLISALREKKKSNTLQAMSGFHCKDTIATEISGTKYEVHTNHRNWTAKTLLNLLRGYWAFDMSRSICLNIICKNNIMQWTETETAEARNQYSNLGAASDAFGGSRVVV